MRRDGIPYVKNGVFNPPFPVVPLEDMTLEEIKKKYLKMCAKSNGDPAVCSKCQSPCREGKRAIQILANEIYNDPPVPLYGGKTLIERAREENMQRRQKKELEEMEKKMEIKQEPAEEQKEEKKEKRSYQRMEDWYNLSLQDPDPTRWVMNTFKISRAQAKKKIYAYRYNHGMTGSNATKAEQKPTVTNVVLEQTESPTTVKVSNDVEAKIEALMKLQEKHKNIMLEMQAQYEKAKARYEETKKKVDILCSAMDIMNE